MVFSYGHIVLCVFASLILTIAGQRKCEDYSPDPNNCAKFVRCFYNLRIRFTCPRGTAWENSLKTCVLREYVEACDGKRQIKRRQLDNETLEIYDADSNALQAIPVARTLAEAEKLGPIVAPKQFRCTFCVTGICGVVIDTIQCFCGTIQCPPATTTPVQVRNPCAVNPCLNGGQCVPNGPGFLCNCPATFTGNRCEAPVATPCQPNPCQNGGVCSPQGNTFSCQCPPTYMGRCCEIRITTTTPYDPCRQSPCRNGGTCIPTGLSFVCQCPTGYYGACCEIRNYCVPNPCNNNGFCLQTTTGYVCRCTYPYTGTNCQQMITTTTTTTTTTITTAVATRAPCGSNCACIVIPCPFIIVYNPCAPNPCQNMGGCAVQNNIARCYCSNYYTGYYCQFQYTGRSLASKACNKTCLNGGQCYIDEQRGGRAQCSCPDEYYGSRCEHANRPKSCTPKNPCMNNGKCVTTSAGSQCVCREGTSGVLCEKVQQSKSIKYCPLDCQAGGTCVYVQSKAQCRCPKGRTGRLCQTRSPKSLSNDEDELDIF